MICLRLVKHYTDKSNRETFLYLIPGTFYITETIDRDTGAASSTHVCVLHGDMYQVVESAREIEDKINAQTQQP